MVTIKDVAKHAGVSVATVSRVINKKEPLTEKTIKKVNDAIEELGYYPNTYARTLVGRKDNVLGVMLPFFNNPFHSELAQEIEFWAKENQFHILFTATGNSDEERFRALEYLLSRQVSGIIISTYINPEAAMEMRRRCKVPILELLNHLLEESCSVMSDDRQGGILAARHLYSKNCKKVVHVGGRLEAYRYADERTFAFEKECQKLGISCKVYKNRKEVTNLSAMRDLINLVFYENEGMDGIFFSNDILAAQGVSYALTQGYRIPDEIRIMGYDGIFISELMYPPLTTIQQNFQLLAKTAIKNIIGMINGEEIQKLTLIPVNLIERKTT